MHVTYKKYSYFLSFHLNLSSFLITTFHILRVLAMLWKNVMLRYVLESLIFSYGLCMNKSLFFPHTLRYVSYWVMLNSLGWNTKLVMVLIGKVKLSKVLTSNAETKMKTEESFEKITGELFLKKLRVNNLI